MTEQTSTIQSDASIQIVAENATNRTWVLIATWSEPKDGMSVHGTYTSKDAAIAATYADETLEQYAVPDDDGEMYVTDDVTWIVAPVGEPIWI
jgi:hypothetical protein